ncbi:MAG TPA: lysylphosphatidylglycerol synthase transmembrane domain-containing protein [Candidatus Baltobacteraceae bacterium]|nr:lysylphosphatidylglycerol synthase transmembrane domain-containing protein [Candidatus Baltobacteraceae bacterium]
MKKSRRYLLLVVALAALGYFFYKFRNAITLEGFRWGMVTASLRHSRVSFLLLGIVVIYICFAIRALRWIRFCKWLGPAKFWNVYSTTLMGFTCVFLLGRAGEPIRPVLIARKDSLSMPGMFGVYVLERISDAVATLVLAGCALVMLQHGSIAGLAGDAGGAGASIVKIARSTGVLLLVALVAAIAFLVYFRYHGAGWLGRKLHDSKWRHGWRGKVVLLLEGFIEGLQGIRTWGDLGALAGYTAIHWALVALVYELVTHAFGGKVAQLSFGAVILVLAFTLVGSAVQLPGVGGGAQLATFLVLTLVLGVEKEPAATVAIVLWLVSFASCCLAGLPWLFHEGWSMGDLRRMAQAEEKAGEEELLAEAEQASDSPDAAKEQPR